MNKDFEGIIFYKNNGIRVPVLCSYASHLQDLLFLSKEHMSKIKKDFPKIKGKLYIEVYGMGVYLLQTEFLFSDLNSVSS
ncbi:hypothetical protein GHI93_11365 [Lactococcus hircilactis]|uniref:Uncharacterized protein n=1 Tax=Lactococcus hircilactis TaxID=1494462 RepID=A0A7X1ZA24_9LACT|nr:hypothetical protein [Lactococcus hircilactis]MQW40518.1 hypothetical protein [Lactococcus hircilactis]